MGHAATPPKTQDKLSCRLSHHADMIAVQLTATDLAALMVDYYRPG